MNTRLDFGASLQRGQRAYQPSVCQGLHRLGPGACSERVGFLLQGSSRDLNRVLVGVRDEGVPQGNGDDAPAPAVASSAASGTEMFDEIRPSGMASALQAFPRGVSQSPVGDPVK